MTGIAAARLVTPPLTRLPAARNRRPPRRGLQFSRKREPSCQVDVHLGNPGWNSLFIKFQR